MPDQIDISAAKYIVGVISDTHGLLRPEALAALAPAQHILHAGDVGDIMILKSLRKIAPVTAIRGNIDVAGPCSHLPATDLLEISGRFIYMVHSIDDLDIRPAAAQVSVVVYGHSHRAVTEVRDGVLYFNPGSAGPRRFALPITVGLLTIGEDAIEPYIIALA